MVDRVIVPPIPPMTNANRIKIYRIINEWTLLKGGTPLELCERLREAGFPIVTWNDVIERYLRSGMEPDTIIGVPRNLLLGIVDILDAGVLGDEGEVEEASDYLRMLLYPQEYHPVDTDGQDHTDLPAPIHLVEGQPHT